MAMDGLLSLIELSVCELLYLFGGGLNSTYRLDSDSYLHSLLVGRGGGTINIDDICIWCMLKKTTTNKQHHDNNGEGTELLGLLTHSCCCCFWG